MKTLGCCGLFLFLSLLATTAQTTSPVPPGPPVLIATNNLQRIFGPTAVYDGLVPDVKRRGGLLSVPDWHAPVVPGREFKNVSIHPATGQAQGLLIFAVRF